jgi:hypothetical protein
LGLSGTRWRISPMSLPVIYDWMEPGSTEVLLPRRTA